MRNQQKDLTIKVDNRNITIGTAGVWIDHLVNGKIQRSEGLAWEDLSVNDCVTYTRLYQVAEAFEDHTDLRTDFSELFVPIRKAG